MSRLYPGLVIGALACGAEAPDGDPAARLETRALAESVYLVSVFEAEGPVNSVMILGTDGTLLVDHTGDWQTLTVDDTVVDLTRRAWTERGGADPVVLINTHWHGDHTGGNVAYGESALIIAHENTRARLAAREQPTWFDSPIGPMVEAGWPDSTFSDSLTFPFGNQQGHLWHFGRAHTEGDAVVFLAPSHVVHMGDLYHGADDPSFALDMVGLANTIDSVVARIPDDAQVVTGHGGVTSKDDLSRYAVMLRETIEAVERAMGDGQSLEEIQADGLPERWRDVVTNQEIVAAWIAEMHRSLMEMDSTS